MPKLTKAIIAYYAGTFFPVLLTNDFAGSALLTKPTLITETKNSRENSTFGIGCWIL